MAATTLRTSRLLCAALAAAGLLHAAAAVPARAQDRGVEASYMAIKLIAGAGGQVEVAGEAATHRDDLVPSWGMGAQYMARVHRHFAVGGLIAFQTWLGAADSNAGRDRNVAVDGLVVPAAVLPLDRELELYVAAGIGFSMNSIGSRGTLAEASGVELDPSRAIEVDETIHLMLLPAVGARLALGDGFGVLAELGYAQRWYEHELRVWIDPVRDATRDLPVDITLGQVTLALGVFF